MTSKVDICNLAISHLGVGKSIATFDTERSEEASACRTFWDQALKQTLRDFHWPFSRRTVTLALVEEDPTTEWAYAYRYPSTCIEARKLLSGTRNETRQTRIAYQIAADTEGRLIYTDLEDAVLEYSALVTDTSLFPDDFAMALSCRLAVYIAPRLCGPDNQKQREYASQLYVAEISQAKANARNEEQPEEMPESELISGRA